MGDRTAVRLELERKRIQLAQLRQERERRSRMLLEREGTDSQLSKDGKIDDADAVLQALGLSSSLSRASTAPSNVASLDQSRISTASPDISTIQPLSQQSIQETSLQIVHVNQVNFRPKERVIYDKSTQTVLPAVPAVTSHDAGDGPDAGVAPTTQASQQNSYYVLTYPEDDYEEHSSMKDDNVQATKSTSTTEPQDKQTETTPEVSTPSKIRLLSEDERKQVELREDYQQFIEKAIKILERALQHNESSDIFIQYFPDGSKGEMDSDRKSGNKLSLECVYFCEKWSKNRCVTSFDWSTQYPELLLASYYTNEQAPSDPDGTLLVWNTRFKNISPEYVFHCQSPIMSCCFAKFHPGLIVGGTYSGQIVLWDMRSHKKTPVQRSPLIAAAHTHPVYCAKVVGTQNAHNLISVSTDGKLCSWSLDMLSAPQETMELNQHKQTKSVAVTCMSFHPDDYNNFLVGSEEGSVYSACRHGSKTGILSSFDGHQGLVTSVDYQPTVAQAGYSRLFLTSSIDWTVKLWDSKAAEPIHTFESNGDYIYDVKWSPNNPDLFATADGDGRVDIWNLAHDKELPTASTHIEPVAAGDSKMVQPSLNKLIWTPNGNQVVVGDDVGRIHVYNIGSLGEHESRA